VYGCGALAAPFILLRLSSLLYTYLKPSSLNRYLDPSRGSWAVVTGASDGIGRALAQELCARGFNVILHGRNPSKLEALKQSLNNDFPSRSVRTMVLDASTASPPQIGEAVASISDLQITVLINNVGGTAGILSTTYKNFPSITPMEIKGLMHVNDIFAIHLIRALLPILRRNSPGLLMNIGSYAAIGVPYVSIYAGTKGFLASMTNAVAAESMAEGWNIEVMHMKVGAVHSAGNKTEESFFVPGTRVFAKSCLDRVGCGSCDVTPFWPHALQGLALEAMPERVRQKMLVQMIKPLMEASDKEE